MTQQNKAREALEALYYIEECTKYMSSIHPHHFGIVRSALTILERLEGVDRVALREAIERHNRFCNDENTTASDIYLDGQMGADNELFRQAARKYHALLPHLEKLQGWEPIESAPRDEIQSYLVFVPKQDSNDDYDVVQQVSNFQGDAYPDAMQCSVDWHDRVIGATHWKPLDTPDSEPVAEIKRIVNNQEKGE